MKELYIPNNSPRGVLHYRDENGDVWIRQQRVTYAGLSVLVCQLEGCEVAYDMRKVLEQWLSDYGLDVERSDSK